MSKEAYFSHDSNARNDEKIIALRIKYGMEGYGIYFGIIERLRENADYTSTTDYSIIAFDLRVDVEKVKSIVEDFGLFMISDDGTFFYSESFLDRMKPLDDIREKKRIAGIESGKRRKKSVPSKEDETEIRSFGTESNTCSTGVQQVLNINEQSRVEVVEKSKVDKEKCSVVEESKGENYDDDTARLFKDFNNFLKVHAPQVLELPEQFTPEQFRAVMRSAKHRGRDDPARLRWIGDICKEMHNKPKLAEKYHSAFTTYQLFEKQKIKKLANT